MVGAYQTNPPSLFFSIHIFSSSSSPSPPFVSGNMLLPYLKRRRRGQAWRGGTHVRYAFFSLFLGVWNRDGRCCLQEARRSGIKCRREIFLPLVKQGLGEIFFAPTRFLLFALLLLLLRTRAFAKFAQTSSPPLLPFVLPAPMKNSPCAAVVILPSSPPLHISLDKKTFLMPAIKRGERGGGRRA